MALIPSKLASSQVLTKGLSKGEAADALKGQADLSYSARRPSATSDSPTLSGWNAGTAGFSLYRDSSGTVHLQGSLICTNPAATTAFVIVPGFRPRAGTAKFRIWDTSTSSFILGFAAVNIFQMSGTNGVEYLLDGITWPT